MKYLYARTVKGKWILLTSWKCFAVDFYFILMIFYKRIIACLFFKTWEEKQKSMKANEQKSCNDFVVSLYILYFKYMYVYVYTICIFIYILQKHCKGI